MPQETANSICLAHLLEYKDCTHHATTLPSIRLCWLRIYEPIQQCWNHKTGYGRGAIYLMESGFATRKSIEELILQL